MTALPKWKEAVVSSSKNQLGKETFLPLGVINVCTRNPDTQHWTTRTRMMHRSQVCLPKHLGYFHFKELGLLSLVPIEKHELFYTDFGKDSLRKTNYKCRLPFQLNRIKYIYVFWSCFPNWCS